MKPALLPDLLKDKKWRVTLRLLAILVGLGFGAFAVFQILFLYKVLPHGGIW